jgi:hypothetical protein
MAEGAALHPLEAEVVEAHRILLEEEVAGEEHQKTEAAELLLLVK